MIFPADSESDPRSRYHLFSQVVTGGMGETIRAWDKREGRPVVIKRPRRSLIDNPDFLTRFEREARTMKRLGHPHIVPIVDTGELDGIPFYAMPFLPGGSLYTRRARDESGEPLPNPPETLRLWLPQIAEALDHLHAHGIVHRDVKPANILFDVFWHAYIADFGIAKVVEDSADFEKDEALTATQLPVGTQEYMGPEHFMPHRSLTGAVDQYALAVTVFELLVGHRPFIGQSAHVVVEITTQPPPSLQKFRSDLPRTLVEAVERGLAKRPDDRFVRCSDFARAVLVDVPPWPEESSIARLACPTCANVIRIATKDAGRTGTCPKCRERLVVAGDLSALWTNSEQAIITAALAGGSQPPTLPERASRGASASAFPEPIKFRPLSKGTSLPHARRNKQHEARQATIVTLGLIAASVVTMCMGALILSLAQPPFAKDPDSGRVVDQGRLMVFSPRGFSLSPRSAKAEYLLEYTQSRQLALPRVRVYAGGDPPSSASNVSLHRGDGRRRRRGRMWTVHAARISGEPARCKSTLCVVEVGGRPYTVEVTAAEKDIPQAELLCRLVASWLELGGTRPPPRPL